MKSILDDLSMDDHFSVIDFNHNVRCWSEDMVPASSIQVDEAKKYIQNIKPNGGRRGKNWKTHEQKCCGVILNNI